MKFQGTPQTEKNNLEIEEAEGLLLSVSKLTTKLL